MSFHPFVLLMTATALLWQNRRLAGDKQNIAGSGNQAALFTSGLIFSFAAVLAIFNNAFPALSDNTDYQHLANLMEQLAIYAALPLMVINGLVKALGYDWDRTIWGRILLAICAMFALTRTTEWLDYWLMLVMAAGLVTFLLPVMNRKDWNFSAVIVFWLAICAGYAGLDLRSSPDGNGQHWSWLGLTVLPYIICANRWLSLSAMK